MGHRFGIHPCQHLSSSSPSSSSSSSPWSPSLSLLSRRSCQQVFDEKLGRPRMWHEWEKSLSGSEGEKKFRIQGLMHFRYFHFGQIFPSVKKIPSRFQRQLTGEKIESDFSWWSTLEQTDSARCFVTSIAAKRTTLLDRFSETMCPISWYSHPQNWSDDKFLHQSWAINSKSNFVFQRRRNWVVDATNAPRMSDDMMRAALEDSSHSVVQQFVL